jgi:hypothetical protein
VIIASDHFGVKSSNHSARLSEFDRGDCGLFRFRLEFLCPQKVGIIVRRVTIEMEKMKSQAERRVRRDSRHSFGKCLFSSFLCLTSFRQCFFSPFPCVSISLTPKLFSGQVVEVKNSVSAPLVSARKLFSEAQNPPTHPPSWCRKLSFWVPLA